MSQGGANNVTGSGADPIETLTGNSGGAVGPDGVFNVDILGNNTVGIDVVGTPGSNLLTILGLASSETQIGTVELATAVETTTGTSTTLAVHPSGLDTKLGSQTANGIILGGGGAGSNLASLGEATDGQLPIGDTGGVPILAAITAGTNITITNAAGSITIDSTGGSVLTLTAITDADTPYTVLATDQYLSCNVSGGVLTIDLANAPATGRVVNVKDAGGDAATNNITVSTVGGAINIDGALTFVMNTDFEAANFIFNGATYEVF